MNASRRRLVQAILAGGSVAVNAWIARALAKGDVPPGINQLQGTATVNGAGAAVGTPVKLGDRIATGRDSQAVVVVGADAFLLRSRTTIEVRGREG